MNSMASVFHFQPSANQVWPGITAMAAPQLATLVQAELTSMVLSVFHINLAIREESGMILSVNVFAHPVHSGTLLNVSDVLLVSFMLMEVATVQMEPSSMEFNVQLKLQINVLVFQALTGTEPIVSASQDSLPQ